MTVVLPNLVWNPTAASSSRFGHKITLVVIHRWGVRYGGNLETAQEYHGVIDYFKNPANKASAHFVYPGTAVPNEATQMVHYADAAWTEAAYNPAAQDVECADAIWLGHDPEGFAQLARIAAFICHKYSIPPVWSHVHGVCRHADLGMAGGGHLQCPTTNLTVWEHFIGLVKHEALRGDFRPVWGR